MAKVTSNGTEYNYYTCHINFNRDDAYQNECINILEMAGRKKNKLIAILVHQFMNQFSNPDTITPSDIKNCLGVLETMSKIKNPTGGIFAQMPLTPQQNDIAKTIPMKFEEVEKDPVEEVPEDNSTDVDTDVMEAMNMFNM